MSIRNVIIPKPEVPRDLTDRERAILRTIIHLYLLNASPVGSRTLAKYLEKELKLSPASIRNIMADLEELDFIGQPHTSAGRIPTDKGYRYYVDSLMNIEILNERVLKTVKQNLRTAPSDSILKEASKVIGIISQYLGIVQIPQLNDLIVQRIELIQISSTRLLVVVAFDSSIVRTVMLETKFEIENKNIDEITSYINEKFSGKPLKFIRDNFTGIINFQGNTDTPLVRLFIDSVDIIFQHQYSDRIHIAGTQNLLNYPEFEDVERVRGVIELIENEDIIIHILDKYENNEGDIKVFIGKEMQNELLDDYSLVCTKYKIGSASGSIGLIGPKRMNYSKVISLVQYVSSLISEKKE